MQPPRAFACAHLGELSVFKGRNAFSAKHVLALLGLPTLLLCIDLAFRFDFIAGLPFKKSKYIALSYIFEILACSSLILLVCRVRHRLALSALLGIFAAAALTIIYSHYAYFKVLPNVFSLSFMFDNLENTLVIAFDTIGWLHALSFVVGALILTFLIWFSLRYAPQVCWKTSVVIFMVTIACGLLVNNNVRFHPSSFTGVTNTLFSMKYFTQKRFFDSEVFLRSGNMQRRFEMVEHKVTQNDISCLLVVTESVRRRNLSYYGYERETSPFVRSLVDEGRIVVFPRHYANTNSTDYSLPMIMSGVFATEKLNIPYAYDYLKVWAGMQTFFFTAQSMRKSNHDVVFDTSLDAFVYQENSGLPRYCDLGADDFGVLSLVEEHLASIQGPFFGVVQLNNTHYPYTATEPYRRFLPAERKSLNAYDNSLLEMDDIVREYFEILRRLGRLDKTVVVFVSDHGEAFGEHGHSGHLQSLYDEEIAVPLWIYAPTDLPVERLAALRANVDKETSHLDIMPTILDFFTCLEPSKLSEELDGQSLLQPIPATRPIPLVSASLMLMAGYVKNGYKIFRRGEGREYVYELYDLANDPNERRNLWAELQTSQRKEFQAVLASCQPRTIRKVPYSRVAKLTP